MHSHVRRSACMALAAAGLALVQPVLAAEQPTQYMAFYAVGIALDGVVGVGDATADIDYSASDVLDHLDFGAMGSYRYETESWSLQLDVIYASLTGERNGARGLTRAQVELDQAMIEIDASYRVNENLELVVGARYWDYDTEIGLFLPGGSVRRASGDESWVDPLIGARLTLPIGSSWTFVARGDVGGFGVGSDFAWHATAFFDWKIGEQFGALFGYRIFDVDFDDGSGPTQTRFELQQGGPAVGVAFRF